MSWEGATGRWVLSVLLAALLWVAVAAERTEELSLSVPVELEHLPPGLAVVAAPARVSVTLSGPRILLARVPLSPPVCRLDLSGAGEGTVTFRPVETALGLDREIRVSRLHPSPLSVTLGREAHR
ncbi:hypothetical protein LPW11_17560 [Geomonas sp. RF6]|uniref:hypothetical protein n=1 Tax=Geomonas sp. RF6 TaxID=2897342 RepID=UPI001E306373|nr:hypothetical protein [Geomonas sp. RF6]UFS69690.1 hypothetical protein LPW11_17560 [Geomonas sp. RF6]